MGNKREAEPRKQCLKEATCEKYNGEIRKLLASVCITLRKMGGDDPRRVIYGQKVGAASTLVSFLHLLEPLFEGVEQNAMWAVMTVVMVLKYTAGEWVSKVVLY